MATKTFSDVSGKELKSSEKGIYLFDNAHDEDNDYEGETIDLTLKEKNELKRVIQDFVKQRKLDW